MIKKFPENPCAICRKEEATQLCDFVVDYIWTSKSGTVHLTCDLPMCKNCAHNRSGHDFCVQHYKMLPDLDLKDDVLYRRRTQYQSKMIKEEVKCHR